MGFLWLNLFIFPHCSRYANIHTTFIKKHCAYLVDANIQMPFFPQCANSLGSLRVY